MSAHLPVVSEGTRLELRKAERFELAHFLRTLAVVLVMVALIYVRRLLV